jgi:succinate dehydrogenase / fumarate reductase cytochrome b subunit
MDTSLATDGADWLATLRSEYIGFHLWVPVPTANVEAFLVASTTAGPTKTGSLYRGGEGMWSWVLQRITGVAVFFFLLVHVLDTALVRVSPNSYDLVIATYKTPIVNLLEVGLVAAVLFHALNGLRIILVDFWSKGPRYQRQMLWGIVVIWLLIMLPGAFFMLKHTVEALFGSTS